MLRFARLALRNLSRNRRRTGLSAASVVVGVAAAIFLRGFVNGFVDNTLDDVVRGKVGALQIHKAGYREGDGTPLDFAFADDPALRARLLAIPGVTAVTPRITFEGMLGNGEISTMVKATAIDPATEYAVCPRRRDNVQRGGAPLDGKMVDGAILGFAIGDFLKAKVGDTVTLLSAGKSGASNALDLTVGGYLPSRYVFESKRLATVPLAWARDLLGLPGSLTEYVVAVDDVERVADIAARVKAAAGAGYQVETWAELDAMSAERLGIMKIVLNAIVFILAVLVATGIVNTMTMSVFERVREIGTMLAVGTRRRQVMLLFLLEASALGVIGALAGAAIGVAVVAWLGVRGMYITPPGGAPTLLHLHVGAVFIAQAIVFSTVGCVIAALLPARRASRLSPVEALRAT